MMVVLIIRRHVIGNNTLTYDWNDQPSFDKLDAKAKQRMVERVWTFQVSRTNFKS